MTEPIRILMLEGQPADAELVERELRKEGLAFSARRVWTEAAFVEQLRQGWPTVILADFALPGYDGLAALTQARELAPEVPFLFVSGSMGEEVAVNALQQGAVDYVLKQNLRRLGPAVRRALRECELARQRRQDEAHIRELNQLLHAIRSVNNLIVRERDPRRLMEEACRLLQQTRGYVLVWIGQPADGSPWVVPVARAGAQAEYLDGLRVRHDNTELGRGPVGKALRMRQTVLCRDTSIDPAFAPWREAARSRGYRSLVAAPMLCGERLFGMIAIYADHEDAFDAEETTLLEEVAADLALALQSIEDETERQWAERELRQSEERYRALFERSLDGLYINDLEGRFIDANPAALELLGYRREDIPALSYRSLLSPNDLPNAMQALAEVITTGTQRGTTEFRLRRKDGGQVDVETKSSLILHEGKPVALLGIARDITGRKQAEAALRASEETYRVLFESARDAHMTLAPPDWRFSSCNAATVAMFLATDTAGLLSKAPWEMSPEVQPDGRRSDEKAKAMIQTAMRTGSHFFEWTHRRLDGEAFPATVLLARCEFGGQTLLQATVREITEQKRAEQALRDSESLYHSLVEQLPQCVFRKDRQGRFTFTNTRFCELVGVAPDRLLGKSDFDLFPRDLAEKYRDDDARIMELGQAWTAIERYRPPGGRVDRFVEVVKWPLRAPTGEVTGIQGIFWDVTERQQAEEQLRKLARAVDQSPVSIVITDREGKIEFVNPKFTQVTGYTAAEVEGQNPRILKSGEQPAEFYRHLWRTIASGDEWQGEFHNRRKDGTPFWEAASISPIRDAAGEITHFIAVKEDITEKKELQAKFLRTQRLESIGQLAGGIAHDLNNILAPIMMLVPLLRGSTQDPETLGILEAFEGNARRGADIIKQILTFARGLEGKKMLVQPRHVCKDMVRLMRETFPKSIKVKMDTPAHLGMVMADANQLHQVLMNLCVNARDAMPEGGTLTLTAENMVLDESAAARLPGTKPGGWVVLRVADTGTGIPAAILDRIFDPFFTTKETGQGTGLGLSTALGIVKNHGGMLQVASTPGVGTQFDIFLPLVEGQAAESDTAIVEDLGRGRDELILVVDDEAVIRDVVTMQLQKLGYRTLTAANGAEAVALYDRQGPEIDLVLTDLMMPTMDGVKTICALREKNPALKVVAATGLATSPLVDAAKALGIQALLQKPFASGSLLKAIRGALDGETLEDSPPPGMP